MPAWRIRGLLGVKIATVFPGNAARGRGAVEATYLLSSATTGEPLAVLDGLELTLRRTAAASALAATYLARRNSRSLLMVGAGRLAPYLVAAHRSVLELDRIEVWARRPEQARELCAKLEQGTFGELDAAIEATTDLEAAVRRADLISCATLSQKPLVRGAWLAPGSHLDLVGGYTPSMREADDEAVRRASVFVDTREGALVEAGDLVQPLESGALVEEDVRADLFDLARGVHPGRGRHSDRDTEITFFKSVGTALEDLAAASLVWEGSK
jgi:ornithine cyclodeaminase